MQTRHYIPAFSLLVAIVVLSIYMNNKLDNAKEQIAQLYSEIQAEKDIGINIGRELKEEQLNHKFTKEDNDRLKMEVSIKSQQIEQTALALKEKEAKIQDLNDELMRIHRSGGSLEYQQYLDTLEANLKNLYAEYNNLVIENNQNIEENRELSEQLIASNRELQKLHEIILPELEKERNDLQFEVRMMKATFNIRADVRNFNFDIDNGIVSFALQFDDDEVATLKSYGSRGLRLQPSIVNLSSGMTLLIDPKSDFEAAHRISWGSIQNNIPLKLHVVDNGLKKNYRSRNSVNLSKADDFALQISIVELNNIEVLSHHFSLQRR